MSAVEARALPPFAVVVVSFASSELLRRNLGANPLPREARVVVVDCYSSEAERERVRALGLEHGWDVVLLDENRGFGGGTNAGAALAIRSGARALVALNPDAVAGAAALSALVEAVVADPMLIASPTIVSASGAVWFAGADLYLDDGAVRGARVRERFAGAAREPWMTGACFALAASLWQRLGGFDEDYFLYWEDIDLAHRALAAGARLGLVDAEVVHDAGGTQERAVGERSKSELYYRCNIRNRMLFAVKHLDDAHVRRWARSAPRVAWGVVLRGGRRQLLTSAAPWRALARGLRDSRALARRRLARRPHALAKGA